MRGRNPETTAMLELEITHMVEKDGDEMPLLSGSVAELGPNAGILTWGNSKRYAEAHPLLTTPEQIQEAKDYFKEFGAWSEEKIAGWSDSEVQAMVVQHIAARIREVEHFDNYEAFKSAVEQGSAGGEIYKGHDGRWYALLSH
jgi:hypothetical protein